MSFYFTLEPPPGVPAHAGGKWFVDSNDGWTIGDLIRDAEDDYGFEPNTYDLKRAGVAISESLIAEDEITEGETLQLVER